MSVSTDGEVLLWTVAKAELLPELLMRLHAPADKEAAPPALAAAAAAMAEPAPSKRVVGGLCMDFCNVRCTSCLASLCCCLLGSLRMHTCTHTRITCVRICVIVSAPSLQAPGQEHVYLVGSEEGAIHRCSKAYGADYLSSYGGHSLPVYAVRWNSMHPGLFLSCSADWSVKVRAGRLSLALELQQQAARACCSRGQRSL